MITITVTENTDKTLKLVADNYILGNQGDKGFAKFTVVIPKTYLTVDLSTLKAYLVYKLQNGRYNNIYLGTGTVASSTVTYTAFELLEQNNESYPALFSQAGKVEIALSFETLDGTKYKSTLPNKQFTNKEAIGLDGQLASQNPATIKELQLGKMDKVIGGTLDHVVVLDENGNAKDGGQSISEIVAGNVSALVESEALIRQANDEVLQTNIDDKLDKTGDGKDVTVTFTQATIRENIANGEKLSVMFAKIKKFFADLKTVAFTGSYNDLSNRPTLLSLGETSGTAYRGDRGKTAYDHSQATGNPHGTTASDIGAITQSDIDNQTDQIGGLCSYNSLIYEIRNLQTITTNHTLQPTDSWLIINANNTTFTLPNPSSLFDGKRFRIINNATRTICICSSELIQFGLLFDMAISSDMPDYIAFDLTTDGTYWYASSISNFKAPINTTDDITEGIDNLFNRQADWNQSTNTAPDYIKNKPTLFSPTINTPTLDQVIRYNGAEWVNGEAVTSSASNGIEFFPDTTDIIAKTTENAFSVETLNKFPVTTAENVEGISCVNNTVIGSAYLYNTAMGRTVIDAGTWQFDFYASVSSTASGRVSTLTKNMYAVSPYAETVTMTGNGAERTVTASSGTPFTASKIVASTTNTAGSYLQTPKGAFLIVSRSSDTVVTISVPVAYTNESTVAFSVWKKLFGATSPTITSTGTNYSLYTTITSQGSFTVTATDKLGMVVFGTSNNTTTVNYVYNGNAHYSHFSTPLITMHNNLAGVQGGTTNEYYHLSSAEYASLPKKGTKVQELTASGTAAFLTFSNLDILADGGLYEIIAVAENWSGAGDNNASIRMYINGDTTEANYGNSPTTAIQANANVFTVYAYASYATLQLGLFASSRIPKLFSRFWGVTAVPAFSGIGQFQWYYKPSVLPTNITSLTFKYSDGTTNLPASLKIEIWKRGTL